MSWRTPAAVILVTGLTAVSATAQTMQDLRSEIESFYSSLNGREIPISGGIGTIFGEDLHFGDSTGNYSVLLDAGREARRDLEGASLTSSMFRPPPAKFREWRKWMR